MKQLTDNQIEFLASAMVNGAQAELVNYLRFQDGAFQHNSKYFKDTYKHLDLFGHEEFNAVLRKVLKKYLQDNEELYVMYGKMSKVLEEEA